MENHSHKVSGIFHFYPLQSKINLCNIMSKVLIIVLLTNVLLLRIAHMVTAAVSNDPINYFFLSKEDIVVR